MPDAPTLLPGGLPRARGLARDYAFRRPDGALELVLAECAAEAASAPEAVSRALVAALAELAGEAPTRAAVDALCVADRQFLMRALDAHLGRRGTWFDATCSRCATSFDFHLDPIELPVKPAGSGFPLARVKLGRRRVSLRVPTGADQIRILREPPERRREALLRGLEVRAEGAGSALPAHLDAAHYARCDAALEAQAPELACQVMAPCPGCGHTNRVALDPYGALGYGPDGLLGEVHRLAWHYHWSEAEILALPGARRAHYLRLIDAARGMTQ